MSNGKTKAIHLPRCLFGGGRRWRRSNGLGGASLAAIVLAAVTTAVLLPTGRAAAQGWSGDRGKQEEFVAPPGFIAPQQHAESKLTRILPKRPPATLQERKKVLGDLYAHLATADDKRSALRIAHSIEQIWLHSGSDTIAVLMERSLAEVNKGKLDLARDLLDAVVELAPGFAEGWNRRAVVHFMNKDYNRALGDLRRVLALEPNHFKALEGLGQILRDVGKKKSALEAYQQLRSVHPFWAGTDQILEELKREVEGQGI